MQVYNIIEVANVHAGSLEYMNKLIDDFRGIKNVKGIKFQPFKYDKIAHADFSWYSVYQELYFSIDKWKSIIDSASKDFDVWIDTFDEYSLEVIESNLDKIAGLKFQASILFNKKLVHQFARVDLSKKTVMLNISGIELEQIEDILTEFKKYLNPKKIVLQVGFQGYPTELQDNGLNKLDILKSKFSYELSFADHIDADSEDSIVLPVIAIMHGATYIEKHICLEGEKPKYDHYSSLSKEKYTKYLEMSERYSSINTGVYINEKEKKYLSGTIQIPTLTKNLTAGQLINLTEDVEYKRTARLGLRTNEMLGMQNGYHILASNKQKGDTLQAEDYKKATIAVIIACRLKSSRLPRKAVAKIGDLSSVEFCIKNSMSFRNINHFVLATSDVEEDAELEKYTYSPSVIFHKGHPLDVIERYLGIINILKVDVIVRITADMPYVSNDILEPILKSHFESGADYSRAKKAAIGTNLEVINAEALRRVKTHFPSADYSEYMTYYFTNNPEHFKINEIDLPKELVRDYRLTLDYPEDLELFNKIQDYLKEKNLPCELKNVFHFLDENPEIAAINSQMEVKYFTDKTLVDTLNKYTKIK
jgi:N,N'-diacetyllegionaminate synthase